ncbi:MAG: hypothetical protein ABR523_08965 [Desulfurivibrionaceae bacterium]
MTLNITDRAELDRWEQDNIAEAETWAFRRRPGDLLSVGFASSSAFSSVSMLFTNSILFF